ncbi:MAG: hypothetical protein NTX32_06580 [Candidatus Firestonebacteria bacterium]|nr:hypothetical protein [Candidatus Firestonebacteria bacterium]
MGLLNAGKKVLNAVSLYTGKTLFIFAVCFFWAAAAAGEYKAVFPPADPKTLPEVPVVRPGKAADMQLDGLLDEAAWKKAVVYSDFGLDTGEGLTDFPTRVHFLYSNRTLWIALECDIPKPIDGGEIESVLEKENIEIFLDNTGSKRMYYHIGMDTKGVVDIPGFTGQNTAKACQSVVKRTKKGYRVEMSIALDVLSDFGAPNKDIIGVNVARQSIGKRWSSLCGIIGQGSRADQFWTLLLDSKGGEKLPQTVYRPIFKNDADLSKLASGLLSVLEEYKKKTFEGRPLVDVRMKQLENILNRSKKDRWGSSVSLGAAVYRAFRVLKELLPETGKNAALLEVEKALLPGKENDFPSASVSPKSGWRECAFTFSEDGSSQPYALYVPGNVTAGKKLPLVVYLHGSNLVSYSDGLIMEMHQPPIEFLMVRVNARKCKRYGPSEKKEINEVIKDISAKWPVDEDRISLFGFSAGAFASAELVVEQQGKYSAAAVVAGRFKDLRAGNAPSLPLIAIWGLADPAVPFKKEEGGELSKLTKNNGYETIIYVLPVTDHSVPMAGFEFWLASKSRKK